MRYTTEGLEKAGLDVTAPFSMVFDFDPEGDEEAAAAVADFHTVARILPGRRVSGLASVDGVDGFAKVFYGHQARRYWHRELMGSEKLQAAGIPAAAVLRRGSTADGAGFVVLFEALQEGREVTEADSALIADAVELLGRLHDADLLQTDVHLGNFVWNDSGTFVVDADGIRGARLLRVQFANLGMLLAQRQPLYDIEIAELWDRYVAGRGEYVADMGASVNMPGVVRKQRRVRVRRYMKKTLRECTEFRHERSFRSNVLVDRERWQTLQRFCLFPAEVIEEGEPIKLGNSSTVVRLALAGEDYIVKRYNLKNPLHRVRRWLKPRARRAWQNGHKLSFLGIPTARPVALIETRFGFFPGVSYLVMPDCGARHLLEVLDDDPGEFEGLARQTIAILEQLAAAGLRHGDLKVTNFIVDDDGVVRLVDFDGLDEGDSSRDVSRFMQNWLNSDLKSRWQALIDQSPVLAGAAG